MTHRDISGGSFAVVHNGARFQRTLHKADIRQPLRSRPYQRRGDRDTPASFVCELVSYRRRQC